MSILSKGNTPVDSNCSKRMKYWSELSDTEKIERMRDEVKRQQHQNSELVRRLEKLENHSHGQNGDIKIPLKDMGLNYGQACVQMTIGETYF